MQIFSQIGRKMMEITLIRPFFELQRSTLYQIEANAKIQITITENNGITEFSAEKSRITEFSRMLLRVKP